MFKKEITNCNKKENKKFKHIENAFIRAREKGWNKLYILVDLHDTIFKASFNLNDNLIWLPFAKISLRYLTDRPDICLILWTSSYPDILKKYLDEFRFYGIKFDYINENPEIINNSLSCFDKKLYFNIGVDDKFGFNGESDWYDFTNTIMNYKLT